MGGAGYSMKFDGVDDYIYLGDLPGLNDTATVEMWIDTCRDGMSSITYVSKHESVGTRSLEFGIESHKYRALLKYGLVGDVTRVDEGAQHLALSVGPTLGGGSEFKFYHNGQLLYTDVEERRFWFPTGTWIIGMASRKVAQGQLRQRAFCGEMDEFRMWDTVRTPAQIDGLWNVTLGAADVADPALHVYLNFDDGEGNVATDAKNNAHGIVGGRAYDEKPAWVRSSFPLYGSFTGVSARQGQLTEFSLQSKLDSATAVEQATYVYSLTSLPTSGTLYSDAAGTTVVTLPVTVSVSSPTLYYLSPDTASGFHYDEFAFTVCDAATDATCEAGESSVHVTVVVDTPPVAGVAGAVYTDGVSGYLSVGDFDVPQSFTVELWMDLHSTRSNQCWVGKHTAGASNRVLIGMYQNQYYMLLFGKFRAAGGTPIPGLQHHALTFEATWTGTAEDGTDCSVAGCTSMVWYRNGDVLYTAMLAVVVNVDDVGGLPWVVGMEFDGGPKASDFTMATFDEMRWWDHSRSQTQIQGMMYEKLSGAETGLLAYVDSDNLLPSADGSQMVLEVKSSVYASPWYAEFVGGASRVPSGTAVAGSELVVEVEDGETVTVCLPYVDVDDGTDVTVTLLTIPVNGQLQDGGVAMVAGNAVVDVGACLTYTPEVSSPTTDSFTFEVEDYLKTSANTGVVQINIVPVGPQIIGVEAADPGQATRGFGVADTITITFDYPTNTPPINTVAEFASVFDFSMPLPADVSAAWADASTVVVTVVRLTTTPVVDATTLEEEDVLTSPAPVIGVDGFRVNVLSQLRREGGESALSRSESPELTGAWEADTVGAEEAPEGLITLLVFVGVAVSLIFGVTLQVNGRRPIIRYAQRSFCLMFCLGAALSNLALLVFVGDATDSKCALQPWVFHISSTLMFGGLFVKVWRVSKLFNNSSMKKLKITDGMLFGMLARMLLVDIVILLVWSLASAPKAVLEVKTEEGKGYVEYWECESNHSSLPTAALLWKAGVILYGCYLAFETRNVDSRFSESKHILMAIYNVAFVGGLTLLLSQYMGLEPKSAVFLQALGTVWCTVTSLVLLFVPKFMNLSAEALSTSTTGAGSPSRTNKRGTQLQNGETIQGGAVETGDSNRTVVVAPGSSEAARIAELEVMVAKLQQENESLKKA